ncbi:MAG TPA: PQQ-binding-like beta-propeller repeat protein [Candidatus Limnocylindria bacterium]|jgi:outer membrane protein assembly factor BamB|nr:PQQ-binding-like beta-propeller repeat protein [Candidatus Limnocylindria bacterium]
MKTALRALTALGFGFVTLSAPGADWPCWRGIDGLGVSPDRGFPLEWSKTNHVAWKTELSGRGASSPTVVGDRVYLTTQTEDKGLHVLALDRKDGALLWDREVAKGAVHANQIHNMATPTAAADDKHVWVLFGTGDLACLDRAGKTVWQRSLAKDYVPYHANHGYGSSPMLLDGRLFIPYLHQGPSFVLAVDAATGTNIWKQDRMLGAREEANDSYSSPIFVHNGGRAEVVVAGAQALNAYDPTTGAERWILKDLTVPHPYGRTIAGSTAGDGLIVAVASGFQNRGYTVAVKAGGQGDITATHKAWTFNKFSPDCPTPVIHQGLLFCIRDDGMASCVDMKTGEPQWQERLFTENAKVSPVAADGRIYFTSGQANCIVVKASSKFEVLARNNWNEETLSTPSLSKGQIFLRTTSGLACIAP